MLIFCGVQRHITHMKPKEICQVKYVSNEILRPNVIIKFTSSALIFSTRVSTCPGMSLWKQHHNSYPIHQQGEHYSAIAPDTAWLKWALRSFAFPVFTEKPLTLALNFFTTSKNELYNFKSFKQCSSLTWNRDSFIQFLITADARRINCIQKNCQLGAAY